MKLRTLVSLIGSGQLTVLLSMTRAIRPYHRVAFAAAGLSSGLLRKLAAGPLTIHVLAAELAVDPSMRDGLEAWLQLGVALGELRSGPEGYISTKPNITPLYPFKEVGIRKDDVFRILEQSGVGTPEYYSWRSRSGCYFCFFQRRGEWVGLKEQHPDLFELAKGYEKPEEGYTWIYGEALTSFEDPARVAQIRRKEEELKVRQAACRRPKNLAEAFGYLADADPDEEPGCLICHL